MSDDGQFGWDHLDRQWLENKAELIAAVSRRGDAVTRLGNCRCGQVKDHKYDDIIPHKPGDDPDCKWADVPPPPNPDRRDFCCNTLVDGEPHRDDCDFVVRQRAYEARSEDDRKADWWLARGVRFQPRLAMARDEAWEATRAKYFALLYGRQNGTGTLRLREDTAASDRTFENEARLNPRPARVRPYIPF